MATYTCHFLALVDTLAALGGTVDGADVLNACDQEAIFSTGVQLKRPGQDIEIWTLMREDHDKTVQSTPSHLRSNRMRAPKPDPL